MISHKFSVLFIGCKCIASSKNKYIQKDLEKKGVKVLLTRETVEVVLTACVCGGGRQKRSKEPLDRHLPARITRSLATPSLLMVGTGIPQPLLSCPLPNPLGVLWGTLYS